MGATQRDPWTCGYAAAIANVHRTTKDSSGIAYAMISDGITLKKMREAGAEDFDLNEIEFALRDDGLASKGARGGA